MVEALTKEFDYLKFVEDSSIPPLINNEKILFSDKIYKVNKWGFSQERNLVITEKAVYNFKKKTMKRRIDTASIRGITITKVTEEFVIHGNDEEYDYHFFSSKRKKIIEFVSRTFFEITKREFRLCELDLKTLKSVVTNKKEKKKDQNFSRMPNTNIIPVCIYLYGTKNDLNVNKKTSTVVRHNNTLFSKRKEITDVCLEDFKILKVLGRGSVAKVCLVEYIKTKEIYAMKSIKKDIIIDQEQIENTLLEKKILESLEHPFLVGLIFAFQTEERIYFVMPFLRGGDLFHQLKQSKIFDEEKARFYSSQIAMAIDHLHTYGIIYRDLKPENVLMDDDGYLQLVDFGMAKHLKGEEKSVTFCGTPEYISPEIITGKGQDKTADCYEMLCGLPPFYNENLERMYELIELAELKFPKKIPISKDAQDIIIRLLDKNPDTRLGKNGIVEIKFHPFFATIDFDLVYKKSLNAPFKPTVESEQDVRNFDEDYTNEDISAQSLIPQGGLDLIKMNQEKFKDFNKK